MTKMIEHRVMFLWLSTAPPLPLLSTLVPIYQHRQYIQKHKWIALLSQNTPCMYKRRTWVIGNFTSFNKLTLRVCNLRFQKLSLLVSKYAEDITINKSNERKAITLTIQIVRILVHCISVQSTLLLYASFSYTCIFWNSTIFVLECKCMLVTFEKWVTLMR